MARVNIMLPDDLLLRIDQAAEQEGLNRSKLYLLGFYGVLCAKRSRLQPPTQTSRHGHGMALQDSLRSEVSAGAL